MAAPYSAVSGGSKDAYNFYHSQLCIQIECAFGMMTHWWAILWSAIPMQVSIKKTIALVIAPFKLHNFCIAENDLVPPFCAVDVLQTEIRGGILLETTHSPNKDGRQVLLPCQLLDDGFHFDDVDWGYRRNQIYHYQSQADSLHRQLPRDCLHDIVAGPSLTGPTPRSGHPSR